MDPFAGMVSTNFEIAPIIAKGKKVTGSIKGPVVYKTTSVNRTYSPETSAGTLFDWGHLIALGLGGPDIGENLVPMYTYFNIGPWKEAESRVREHIRTLDGIRIMQVDVTWDDTTGLPSKFTIKINDKVFGTLNHKAPEKVVMLHDKNASSALYKWSKQILSKGNEKGGHYLLLEFLENDDFQALGMQPTRSESVQKYKEFSERQRINILIMNQIRHGKGCVCSDITGEPIVEGLIHVDHIEPKAYGGSNAYGNAQVLSRLENLAKSTNHK